MAQRDHSLDERIIVSARKEFMEKGFMKASLHAIAKNAGITTGALYTRYEGKDDLFRSLVSDVYTAMGRESEAIAEEYMKAHDSRDPELMIESVRLEEKVYRKVLFEHYEACVLFFAKSEGSSVAEELKTMMQNKAEQTIEYMKTISRTDMDLDGIMMIMQSQFGYYRMILDKGWSPEKTVTAMEAVDLYQEAGWKALFSAIL